MTTIAKAALRGGVSLTTFPSHDSNLLAAIFTADGAGPHPTLLLLHGFPGAERNFDLAHSARRAGWNVLVFHYRGAWGSDGKFLFSNALADAGAALEFLRSEETSDRYGIDVSRLAVAGHSMGGFIALMTAARDADVLGAASWAGFNFGIFADSISSDALKIMETTEAWNSQLAPLRGTSGSQLVGEVLEAGNRWDLRAIAPALGNRKILLLAASDDSVASPELHHEPLVQSLSQSSVSLIERTLAAGHDFANTRLTVTDALLEWLSSL